MPKRKILTILFFLVVFGLPVMWYLFLQGFGKNNFDLPKIERLDAKACELFVNAKPTLIIDESGRSNHQNLISRLQNKMDLQNVMLAKYYPLRDSCDLDFDLLLIDANGWVRSQGVFSREEVDRFLAEIDILILNHEKNNRAE